MVIDAHHHLVADWEPYVERLRAECARLGIDRVAVTALHAAPWATNEVLIEALRQHPDFLLGYGFVRPGADSPALVDDLAAAGCRGIKFIWPLCDYDADEALPLYARCEALGLVALFHFGVVAAMPEDRAMDVSSRRMQVMMLDRISRQFPDLQILGAHLGNPDYEAASDLARHRPNVFFDLTGSTLKKKPPSFIGDVFWWARDELYGKMGHGLRPYQKIVFGTDVEVGLIHDVLADYRRVMDALHMTEEDRAAILGGTAARLFGLA